MQVMSEATLNRIEVDGDIVGRLMSVHCRIASPEVSLNFLER